MLTLRWSNMILYATPLTSASRADSPSQNFCFPVTRMESDAVVLEPLIVCRSPMTELLSNFRSQPSIHAREAYENLSSPEGRIVFDYLPVPVPSSFEEYLTMLEGPRGRQNTEWCHFAIIDKTHQPPRLAGTIALLGTSVATLSTEIGCVLIFPKYQVSRAEDWFRVDKLNRTAQRTHINTHANALLLRYCFEVIHLRRVQWKANSKNERSVKAAQRLGFQLEGVIRWERPTPANGFAVDNVNGLGQPERGLGRHSVLLATCWDTWLSSGKATIDELMARPVVKS